MLGNAVVSCPASCKTGRDDAVLGAACKQELCFVGLSACLNLLRSKGQLTSTSKDASSSLFMTCWVSASSLANFCHLVTVRHNCGTRAPEIPKKGRPVNPYGYCPQFLKSLRPYGTLRGTFNGFKNPHTTRTGTL